MLRRDGFGDALARNTLTGNSIIADCVAPEGEWPEVRGRLDAIFRGRTEFVYGESDVKVGARLTGDGYVLKFGAQYIYALVPRDGRDAAPFATGMPQLLISKPRLAAGFAFLHQVMTDCRLLLQMCKETGNHNIAPTGLEVSAERSSRVLWVANGEEFRAVFREGSKR